MLWGTATPTKVGVGIKNFSATSTGHRYTLLIETDPSKGLVICKGLVGGGVHQLVKVD